MSNFQMSDSLVSYLLGALEEESESIDWQVVKECCPLLSYAISAANNNGIIRAFERDAGFGKIIEIQELQEQIYKVQSYGFSKETSENTILLIIVVTVISYLREENCYEIGDIHTYDELLDIIFDLCLCRIAFGFTSDSAQWYLRLAVSYGSKKAKPLLDTLLKASNNDFESIKTFVMDGLSCWQKFDHSSLRDNFNFHIEDIGLIYELMSRVKDDPAVAVALAEFLINYGHAGDEVAGYRLIAEAALGGNYDAWCYIEENQLCSDLIDQLISKGMEMAEKNQFRTSAENSTSRDSKLEADHTPLHQNSSYEDLKI